jgi:hypothetical protein
MWGILRIVLLVANAGLLAIIVYDMSTERGELTWRGYTLLTLFVLNFVYLLGHKGPNISVSLVFGSTPKKLDKTSDAAPSE